MEAEMQTLINILSLKLSVLQISILLENNMGIHPGLFIRCDLADKGCM